MYHSLQPFDILFGLPGVNRPIGTLIFKILLDKQIFGIGVTGGAGSFSLEEAFCWMIAVVTVP